MSATARFARQLDASLASETYRDASAAPLPRRTFEGWYLGTQPPPLVSDITASACRNVRDLAAASLDEAAGKMATDKKPFVIRELDTLSGLAVIHLYRVTAKRAHRFDPGVGYARQVELFTPVYLGTLAVDEFAPRRPFDCQRDDRLTGRQTHDPAPVIDNECTDTLPADRADILRAQHLRALGDRV